MKIDDLSSDYVDFADVFVGCVFKFNDEYFIKIHVNGKAHALSLKNYGVYYMGKSDKIEPYFASRLVIKKYFESTQSNST